MSTKRFTISGSWGLLKLALALFLLLALIAPGKQDSLAVGTTIYVDADASGTNDGSSWDNAFTDLQDGLTAAQPDDEIWVAAGTYYPGANREDSFAMKNQVAIYGGFDPTTGDVGWDDRDWVANETILSGDIGTPGDNSDNCYNVFYHPDGTNLDSSAVLDGFVISGGNADGGALPHFAGGGMHNDGSSPVLTNCTFSGNSADGGGGMYNRSSSPILTNCTFSGNSAAGQYEYGGGMYNVNYSDPMLVNCTFEGNSADYGGGMYNWYSSPTLTNCTFSGNSADYGGGMYEGGGVITNCIFWGDVPNELESGSYEVTWSDIQDGYPGIGNIDADPLFVDPGSGDYHLGDGSPCIDTGTNDAPDLPPFDFEGDDRIIDGDGDGTATVDMGVDEVAIPQPYLRIYLPLVVKNH